MTKKIDPAAVWVDPTQLKPWPQNPRIHDVDAIARSIERFGFAAPIVARESDGRIVAGHGRLQAAVNLGLEQVPVRYLELTDEEADALAVADNQLLGDWDEEALGRVLAKLEQNQPDLIDLLGFDEFQLDALFGQATIPEFLPTDGDQQPELDQTKVYQCPECGHEWQN